MQSDGWGWLSSEKLNWSCFMDLADAERRVKELKKFTPGVSFQQCWGGDFGSFARVLQSDSDHHLLWPCRAGVPGDVPVRGLWRKHHLSQRDSQISQLSRVFTLAPQVQAQPVEPSPTSEPQMFLRLVPASVPQSTAHLAQLWGFLPQYHSYYRDVRSFSWTARRWRWTCPLVFNGSSCHNCEMVVDASQSEQWLQRSSKAEASGAQWRSKLRIQQPAGPQIFSSVWGWLGFQHQKHLELLWRPKELIEIFRQVQRRMILVTWC